MHSFCKIGLSVVLATSLLFDSVSRAQTSAVDQISVDVPAVNGHPNERPKYPTALEYEKLLVEHQIVKREFLLKLREYLQESNAVAERLGKQFGDGVATFSLPTGGRLHQLNRPIWPIGRAYIGPQTGKPERLGLVMRFTDEPLPWSEYQYPKTCINVEEEFVPLFVESGWTARKFAVGTVSIGHGWEFTFSPPNGTPLIRMQTDTTCLQFLAVDF